jgi:hypothetical protein
MTFRLGRLALGGGALALALIPPALAQTYHDTGGTIAPQFVPIAPNVGPLFTTSNPGQVAGTFSASLSGFQPTPSYSQLSVATGSSARVALPSGTSIVVYNTGSNPAFVLLGGSSVAATTSDDMVPAGSAQAFAVGSNTYIAAISTGGSTSLNISGGSGLPTGWGGGGGGPGGSVPTGSAGSPNSNVVTVQGISGGTGIPVTGTFWQATQPVSLASLPALAAGSSTIGKVDVLGNAGAILDTAAGTSATQAIGVQGVTGGVAVPVSGNFYQATQPVSLASLPALATGSNTIGSIANTSFGISGTLPAFASAPTIVGAGTAGAPSGGVVSIQGVSGGQPVPISGTVSASIGGFAPTPAYTTPLSVSTTSARVAAPSGTVAVVYNVGSNDAYVTLGNSSVAATTSDDVVKAGGWMAFTLGSNAYVAAITASGSTTLNVSGGQGIAAGSGGGSAGGSVPTGSAGSPNSAVLTVQGIGGGTAQPVSLASLPALAAGSNTIGAVTQASGPWTTNHTQINGSAVVTSASGVQEVGVVGSTGGALDSAAGAANGRALTIQGNSSGIAVPVSGAFYQATQPVSLASLPALASGSAVVGKVGIDQTTPGTTNNVTLSDASGNAAGVDSTSHGLKVDVVAGGGSGGTSSNFGSAFPTPGTAVGGEYYTPGTLTSGDMYPLTLDSNGNLKVYLAGCGTACNANGQQTMANSAPVVLSFDQSAVAVKGGTASGASLTENPLADGGRAAATQPTAVSDGQKVALMTGVQGKLVVDLHAPSALTNNGGGNDASGVATAITVMAASGSASYKEYLVSVHCGRDDAGTTAIRIVISDGTTTRYLVLPNSGGGGGNNARYEPPLAFAANTAVTATPSASVTGNISCDAEGYNAP